MSSWPELILLTDHGEKFFSTGASINYLNILSPRYGYFFCLLAQETLSRLAALNGHTVVSGLEIAMAAEIRIDIYDRVSLEDFRTDILDSVDQFTLPLAAAKAIGNIRCSVQIGIEIPLEYHLALERELQSDLFQYKDAKKALHRM